MLSLVSAKQGKMQNIIRPGRILILHMTFISLTVHNIATGGSAWVKLPK